jgi:hypothetical protein
MARAINEKTTNVRLTNHRAFKLPAINPLPFRENAQVQFQTHRTSASSTDTHQSKCIRCGGLMVNEYYMDLLNSIGESKFHAKRCVQCGEVVDFVILLNRQLGQSQ